MSVQLQDAVGLNGKSPLTNKIYTEAVNNDNQPLVQGTVVALSLPSVAGASLNVTRANAGAATISAGLTSTSETATFTPLTPILQPGMTITGTGVPAGTYITTVTPGTGFTISQAATATATETLTVNLATVVPFGVALGSISVPLGAPFNNTYSMTTTNTSKTVTYTGSLTGVRVGYLITGSGIPANTYVTAVTQGTSITISNAATASATVTVTISNNSGSPTAIPINDVGQFIQLGRCQALCVPATYSAGQQLVASVATPGSLAAPTVIPPVPGSVVGYVLNPITISTNPGLVEFYVNNV